MHDRAVCGHDWLILVTAQVRAGQALALLAVAHGSVLAEEARAVLGERRASRQHCQYHYQNIASWLLLSDSYGGRYEDRYAMKM